MGKPSNTCEAGKRRPTAVGLLFIFCNFPAQSYLCLKSRKRQVLLRGFSGWPQLTLRPLFFAVFVRHLFNSAAAAIAKYQSIKALLPFCRKNCNSWHNIIYSSVKGLFTRCAAFPYFKTRRYFILLPCVFVRIFYKLCPLYL